MLYFNYQFREKRIEQEKVLLQKQVDWLNGELKNKTDELTSLRKDKVSAWHCWLECDIGDCTVVLKLVHSGTFHLHVSNNKNKNNNKDFIILYF